MAWPRRASLHLREMYNAYGGKVTFISLSVDKDEKEWQKALGEEKLPWNQYLATPELSKSTRTEYDLTSIPTFLVIDPEGKIIFSGHSSGELETMLETKCNI
ncbi:MAG: TlpA family protein disulfide reductase [Butyricimonas paravirosa]